MLSYQHIYHSGNFADVQKHALLAAVLSALKSRHKKLCVIDTHAGRGMYDLSSPEALKKGEFNNGIAALWEKDVPEISGYLGLVRRHNPEGALALYPGSARIARDILRDTDRLVLSELHPGEFRELEKVFEGTRNTETVKQDGFSLLAEKVPPPERQGLVVIDPPYEMKTDYAQVPREVLRAWKKWRQGVFFIWYPILTDEPHRDMLIALRRTDIKDVLVSELRLKAMPKEGFAMHGSGVAIVNPPLPLHAAEDIARAVAENLPGQGATETFWLANRKIDAEEGLV